MSKIEDYNNGIAYPENYQETYVATKHVQYHPVEWNADILKELQDNVEKAELFFDDDELLPNIITGLIKGNVILQGPPGTGKSELVKVIAKTFNVKLSTATAIPDWSTYDTKGGLGPNVDNGGLVGKNGCITDSVIDCCEKILIIEHSVHPDKDSEQATWLFIDEINRAEIDRAFGDMFTVFGSDSYSEKINESRKILLPFHSDPNKRELYVPNRFRLIGAMNNIDKNFVYDLSQALSRRFTFVLLSPPKKENMTKELDVIKKQLEDQISLKMKGLAGSLDFEELWKEIDKDCKDEVQEILKYIRYKSDTDEYSLNAQIGSAQIKDVYETILIQMIISKYMDSPNKSRLLEIADSALYGKIIPVLTETRLTNRLALLEKLKSGAEYSWTNRFRYGLEDLR